MRLLKRFIAYTSITLKRFIFAATLIVSAITFATVIAVMFLIFLWQFEDLSARNSLAMSRQMLESITLAMEEGRNLSDMKKILERYQRSFPGRYVIDLHPAKALRPAAPLPTAPDPHIARVFAEGEAIHRHTFATFEHALPIRAELSCVGCHAGARPGEVLGVLTISEDLKETRNALLGKFFICFFLLLPVPLFMAFTVYRFVNRHVGSTVGRLHQKVHTVNTVSDLANLELELENEEHTFRELDEIFTEFGAIISRVRDVAVGKEMLEFEIKVLERFVITSESIRDWKERINFLLNEVIKVMPAYAIFCVFQIEEELYDIEVFWARPPSRSTEDTMEKIIRRRVSQEKLPFGSPSTVKVINNVVNPEEEPFELNLHQIELQTKSLFIDTPHIGGVVGIGLQSQVMTDPVRSLVIGGILTTLLNVVGSIKAIYKYTRDLEYYATRDPLTHLFNQRIFWELLGYEVGRAERHSYMFGVLVIDMDNFKLVNDTYGHIVGDKFLGKIADTIRESLRLGDILARYGGDEFAVILPEANEEQVFMVANRIREALEDMTVTTATGAKVRGTASVGMAVYPVHAQAAKDLFLFADNMTYKAKGMGRNCIILPTGDDVVEVFQKSSEMSRTLLHALEEKRITPYFQPIVTTDGMRVVCHEVLCRIDLGDRVISAGEFIELAEKLNVVSKIDTILMEKVFEKVHRTGYDGSLFINLSPKSLIIKEFVPMIIRLARDYRINHEKVVFEITERETLKNMTLLENFVMDLKMEGFKFAIDDFGSGFSSFQYIRRLPIDFVKIEGMFVRNMLNEPKDMAFVKTLAVLAKEFGIRTIAEYIENEELLKEAHALGIDLAQGYYTGRPGPDFVLAAASTLQEDGARVQAAPET